MPQKAGSATLKMTMIWKNEISQIAINHKTFGAPSIIEGAPFGMFGMRIFFTTDIRDYTDANHERKRDYLFNLCYLWSKNKSVICDNKCMFAEREHIMAINTT